PCRPARDADGAGGGARAARGVGRLRPAHEDRHLPDPARGARERPPALGRHPAARDRKSTRLNSSHVSISYAVFCLKKKRNTIHFPEDPDRLLRSPTVHHGLPVAPPYPTAPLGHLALHS